MFWRVHTFPGTLLGTVDGARADSVPNLEIETGEIAGAGHASATGRFDDESQSGQVYGSASGRDDIGPDLLQRHGVTGLGGPDG